MLVCSGLQTHMVRMDDIFAGLNEIFETHNYNLNLIRLSNIDWKLKKNLSIFFIDKNIDRKASTVCLRYLIAEL